MSFITAKDKGRWRGINSGTTGQPSVLRTSVRQQQAARIRSYIALIDACLMGKFEDKRNAFLDALERFTIRKRTGEEIDEALVYRRDQWELALRNLEVGA